MAKLLGGLIAAAMLVSQGGAAAAQGLEGTKIVPPLVTGDEPIFVTQHQIKAKRGPLAYETRVGRIPIRNEQTGEVRAYIFFTAYVVKPRPGEKRPLTFVWNGGPMLPSTLLHFEAFGPRRRVKDDLVDNEETLLADSDLVFYDPPLTSFSRVAGNDPFEFYTLLGDVAATSEFIRAYRTRFRALQQPLFIAGESYGVFRATGVSDYLTERGVDLAGTLLISGDTPGISMPPAFYDAMHVQSRAATAFHYKRLPPDLMQDRAATLAEVDRWAREVYWPALERKDALDDAQREDIAVTLARYTGLKPEQVDRKTLVVELSRYQKGFFDGEAGKELNSLDTRESTPAVDLGSFAVVDRYYRDELGYGTSELYMPVYEHGYMPTPGPVSRNAAFDFQYNQGSINPRIQEAAFATNEVTEIARRTPPWIEQALKRRKNLRFFVATGRYDPRNMCEGDLIATATLGPGLAERVVNRCYAAGHIMYRDEPERIKFLSDSAAFIRETVAAQGK
ncbi:S10 family serine carboxypeptidase-like protein [Sphingopyxis panaciterrae]